MGGLRDVIRRGRDRCNLCVSSCRYGRARV